jgi:hypothetical protein
MKSTKKPFYKKKRYISLTLLIFGWYFFFYNNTPLEREGIKGDWYRYSNGYISFEYPKKLKIDRFHDFGSFTNSSPLVDWDYSNKIHYMISNPPATVFEHYEGMLGENIGQIIYDIDSFTIDSLQSLHPEYSAEKINLYYGGRNDYVKIPSDIKNGYFLHERVIEVPELDTITYKVKISKNHFNWINSHTFSVDTFNQCYRRIYVGDGLYGCYIWNSNIGGRFHLNPKTSFNGSSLSHEELMRILYSIRIPNKTEE